MDFRLRDPGINQGSGQGADTGPDKTAGHNPPFSLAAPNGIAIRYGFAKSPHAKEPSGPYGMKQRP